MRFRVGLGFLVPFVLAGVTVLSVLVTDRALALLHPGFAQSMEARLALLCAVSGGVCFAASLITFRWLTGPLERFLKRAREINVLSDVAERDTGDKPATDPAILDDLFMQVSNVLSALDAKALFPDIVCHSRPMREVLTRAAKVAQSDATVLITGESGTGKELVASGIHSRSRRAEGPYIAVNCAAIPDQLLESELFGHERGAFTGAVSAKPGKFELADGGTLFLDEVGDMPLATQAKILRMLENGECTRVGGTKAKKFNVRVVAATNRDLRTMVAERTFREDLYHRLNVFPIHIPPLRERREDIPALVQHFLERQGHDLHCAPEMLQLFISRDWPGNIRELANHVERAAVLAEDGVMRPLPEQTSRGETAHADDAASDATPGHPTAEHSPTGQTDIDTYLAAMERQMICAALQQSGGIQARAAELLGIKPRSLWHRVKKLEINVGEYKEG
ncbi:Nif-specific regulatory protein [Desulfobaculum xiamenense]|uniref:Nif-specific regulatory protein n=1 Tax=Desulfobaculum xiamenense TaxID=995050 RepID=A0A846QV96_9BACT|nr:sigma-54 dependent transcriptional regulator [Desulfobaculum xiamenense]NJB68569.1 Nif-specific regulatory protein [Desulfobaculum xiamenense]